MNSRRIYLDNAATSWPKPEAVYEAVDYYQRELGATTGRGAYREAEEVERRVRRTRQRLVTFLGADDPHRIIFTANGTESLNLAIHGVLRPGDHVVTSVVDHNSVLRPLRFLVEQRGIEVVVCAVRCAMASSIPSRCGGRSAPTRGSLPWCMRRTSPERCSRSKKWAESRPDHGVFLPGGRGPVAGPSADRCAAHRGALVGSARPQRAVGTFRVWESCTSPPDARAHCCRCDKEAPGRRATRIASPTRCRTNTSRAI